MSQADPIFIYVLADGAQHHAQVGDLIRQASAHRNVYAGLPEEKAGDASLFLAHVADAEEPWLAKLDELDLLAPCISLIWSRAGIDALATHLQQFLIADIGDGMGVMLRYFDPRNLKTTMTLWGEDTTQKLMAPILQWKYRGHEPEWQRLDGPMNGHTVQTAPVAIRFDQQQVDAFMAHSEPDQLLGTLVENGTVPADGPYLPRFRDFLARYRRVTRWHLTEPADRLRYCEHSYQYGLEFDLYPEVCSALKSRAESGEGFGDCMDRIPDYVWNSLRRKLVATSETGETK